MEMRWGELIVRFHRLQVGIARFLDALKTKIAASQVVLRNEIARSQADGFLIAVLCLFNLLKTVVRRSEVIDVKSVIGFQAQDYFPFQSRALPVLLFEERVTQP